MILKGAGVCPFIKIGDVVKGITWAWSAHARGIVADLVCDRNTATACRAFRTLAMIVFRQGYEMHDYMNPASVSSVNCDACPILTKDPDHRSKTKWCHELVQAAEATVQEHEDHNRFDIIDISNEEEQNEESSGNSSQQ